MDIPGLGGAWIRFGSKAVAAGDSGGEAPLILTSPAGVRLEVKTACFKCASPTERAVNVQALRIARRVLEDLKPEQRWGRLVSTAPGFVGLWPIVLPCDPASGRRPVVSLGVDVASLTLFMLLDDYNAGEDSAPPGAVWKVYGAATDAWARSIGSWVRLSPPTYVSRFDVRIEAE